MSTPDEGVQGRMSPLPTQAWAVGEITNDHQCLARLLHLELLGGSAILRCCLMMRRRVGSSESSK